MRFITALAGFAGITSATLLGVGANVNADVEVAHIAEAKVDVGVDLEVARSKHHGFKCPKSMSYCPWTKACACPPGQELDLDINICVGDILQGAWPEPDISVYATVDVELSTFCAASPTKIVKYNPHHEYCQASLLTVTFCASADIELEIAAEVEIDINANISADLKNVCAGLHGLYLESVVDAVIAFNTDILGLATIEADVDASLSVGLRKIIKGLTCKLGLGKCHYDCVSYCTSGCKNYIDVDAKIGAHLHGLVGFCILPKVILTINAAKHIVAHVVDGLLCLVGGIIKTVLSSFDCHCH
ncbi:hypothetical protein QQS21_009173 [Conoideocrella luteorostrata]|uniref:Secreted protein n=1 Tax=Conoideocrella luteorostrata TaxID=1105319 RepID=A0AAJ0CHM2_9HYPO|nr:hypothetical protein QQS21_009173 [Conoideocrella luteorostrata]